MAATVFRLDRFCGFFTRNAGRDRALWLAVLSLTFTAITCRSAVVTTRLVASSGDAFPALPDAALGSLGLVRPVMNARGDVAYVAPFTLRDGSSFHGVFVEQGAVLRLMAVDGPLPGSALPVLLAGLRDPVLNNAGELLVVSNSEGLSTEDEALSSNVGSIWRTLVREGEPAPGQPGQVFRRIPATGTTPLLRSD